MPSLKEHEALSKILTGDPATQVHQSLDMPHMIQVYSKILGIETEKLREIYKGMRSPQSQYKSGHRQAFHTPQEAIIIGHLLDGRRGALNALIHLEIDKEATDKQTKQLLNLILKKAK